MRVEPMAIDAQQPRLGRGCGSQNPFGVPAPSIPDLPTYIHNRQQQTTDTISQPISGDQNVGIELKDASDVAGCALPPGAHVLGEFDDVGLLGSASRAGCGPFGQGVELAVEVVVPACAAVDRAVGGGGELH